MSANDNPPSDNFAEFTAIDTLERDLTVGISLAEARIQRLVREAFISPTGAERSLKLLISDKKIDRAIKVLTGDGFANAHHFGPLRGTGFLWLDRTAARAALAQLPEALRDLHDLNNRLSESQVARYNLRHTLSARAKSSDPENKPELKNVRRMRKRMF